LCLLQRIARKWHSMKQQVVGMACDAFWIEECTYLLSASHGPGFRRGKFPKVLHKWHPSA
jgi:hypothetical protein